MRKTFGHVGRVIAGQGLPLALEEIAPAGRDEVLACDGWGEAPGPLNHGMQQVHQGPGGFAGSHVTNHRKRKVPLARR